MNTIVKSFVKIGMLVAFLVVSVVGNAQRDTIVTKPSPQPVQASALPDSNYHSPHKATMYSAVLPGLGQAYNKKYWKIPIIYGGFAGMIYGLSFNNEYYHAYKNAYRDFIVRDPANKSYARFVPPTLTLDEVETTYATWFENALKNKRVSYKRNRDLCIIGMSAIYVLNLIDASVDAHFFNFDVSDDLTLRVMPEVSPSPYWHMKAPPTIGMNLSVSF